MREDNNKNIFVFLTATEIQQELCVNHAVLNLQRMLFNHIGDGALPRSDSNLPGSDKGKQTCYNMSIFEE